MTAQPTRDQLRAGMREMIACFDEHGVPVGISPRDMESLLDQLDQAEAQIKAVREMHNADGVRWVGFPRADEQVTYCTYCQERSPCTTIRTLDGEE